MIQYGDHVHEHENIRVRVRVRVQNPWSTQQKQSERTWLLNLVSGAMLKWSPLPGSTRVVASTIALDMN